MRTNTFFLLILLSVFFISGTAPAQQEEITLSTYYPAPYGEYDELCAEKLLVDLPSAAELQDMQEGDCHITRSMIVGSGIGTGFSYDELEGVGSLPANGDLLIRGYVGIGTPEPNTALDLDGAFSIRGIPTASAPPVAPVDEGRIYFDSDTDTFRVSQNGGAYDDLGTGAGGAFWAETATGNHIYNTNTGNVGIGTTDPSGGYKLKVIGPTKIQGGNLALLDASTTATSSGPSILLGTTGAFQKSSSYSGIHRRVISGTTCTQFTSGMADVMVLTDTGNVGIGTTSPQAKLHVEGQAIIAGGLRPDYDSGWFAINAISNQTYTLNHNLGSIPTRVAIYVSNSSTPTWVQPCNFLSRGVNYQSPENVWMSNTQFIVNICWADPAIFVDANNPAPPGSGIVTSETGYMRVLLWK